MCPYTVSHFEYAIGRRPGMGTLIELDKPLICQVVEQTMQGCLGNFRYFHHSANRSGPSETTISSNRIARLIPPLLEREPEVADLLLALSCFDVLPISSGSVQLTFFGSGSNKSDSIYD